MRRHRHLDDPPDPDDSYHVCLEVPLTVGQRGLDAINAYIELLDDDMDTTALLAFREALAETVECSTVDYEGDTKGYAEQQEENKQREIILEKIGLAAENIETWLVSVWKGEVIASPAQVAAATALRKHAR
jgi:hypothetical protein